MYGKWTECLWGIDPASYESFKKQEKRGDHARKARTVSASCSDPGPPGARGFCGLSQEGCAVGRTSVCSGSAIWAEVFDCILFMLYLLEASRGRQALPHSPFNTALVLPELAEAYLRSQAHLISVFSVLEFSVIYSVRKYWQRLSSQNFGMLMTVR